MSYDMIFKKAVDSALIERQLMLISDDGICVPSYDALLSLSWSVNYWLYPEKGVHPRKQSRELVPKYVTQSKFGGMVVLTYSEHILNGVRLAVCNKLIEPADVVILYCWFDEETNERRVNQVLIDERGNLSDWPRGFFDQNEKDYSDLVNMNMTLNGQMSVWK